jgi:hypothetical protein
MCPKSFRSKRKFITSVPGVRVRGRLGLVVDVQHLAVGQDLPVPAEGKRTGDPLLPAGPRVRPLRQAAVVVRVVHVAVCKSIRPGPI